MAVYEVHYRGWRRNIRKFEPSWFTVTMGTGIMSILLNQFPYPARWLYWISVLVMCLNILLFVCIFIASALRYILWPELWTEMIHDPTQALFVGAVPIGLATIVNMIIFACSPYWGEWVIYTAWGLWMFDSALSITITFFMSFILIKEKEKTKLSKITAVQLFPIIAPLVSSATGANIARALSDPQRALATVLISYVLWGLAFPTTMILLAIYFQRLTIHKLPPREVIVSVFLPLGPPCMGGYAAMALGGVAMDNFPVTHTIHPLSGVILYSLGVLIALLLWGFALLWFFFAVGTIYHCKRFPFNMGWWGFTFPIGTFAMSSARLGADLPSRFFRVVAAITTVSVVILWTIVAAGTIKNVVSGKLFDPALPDLDHDDESCRESTESEVK